MPSKKPSSEIRPEAPKLAWYTAFEQIAPLVVNIKTYDGGGTGFLIANPVNSSEQLIATAAHVVKESVYWDTPIEIEHAITKKKKRIEHSDRTIQPYPYLDTAVIKLNAGSNFGFPAAPSSFIKEGKRMKVGADIGWIGYPEIADGNLCFFNGKISAWVQKERFYYVDGTGIGGVSGGPAFAVVGREIRLIGLITNYKSAPGEGTVTPGLCIVRDIKHARDAANKIIN